MADLVVAVGLVVALAVRARGPVGAVALALVAWAWFVAPTIGAPHAWNLYHYTVGARFFGELGYHDLYAATLAADRAGDDSLAPVTRVRDLRTYARVDRAEIEATWVLDEHLSPPRIAELQRATTALEGLAPAELWPRVFLDRGYVATPPYTAIAAPIARALPAERPLLRHLSTALDPLLLLVGLGAVLAASGVEATATLALLLALFPGTEGRLVGGFLQYDWLAALMVGAAAARTDRPVVAAAALSWATASRLFPALLALGLVLPAVRRGPTPFDRRFAGAFAAFAAIWIVLGALTARGPAAWAEFVPRILHHAAMHAEAQGNVGLRHLLAFSLRPADVPEAVASRAALWWACAALGLAAWAWTASRRSREEALQLGWVPVFLLTVLSQYYWVGVALAVLGPPPDRARRLAVALAALFALGHLARGVGPGQAGYLLFVAGEAALAALLAVWLARTAARG